MHNSEWKIYLKTLLLAYIAIGVAASIQIFYIYNEFNPSVVVVPIIVATIVGLMLGRVLVMRARLRDSHEQFRAVVDIAEEFIYYRDISGNYKYVSPSCVKITGFDTAWFYRNPNFMDSIIYKKDREKWLGHVHEINDLRESETLDIRIVKKGGEVRWIKHICASVTNMQGKQIGVRSSNIDITEQKEHEHQVYHMAYYDPLTDLPNRRLFEKNLESMIEKTKGTEDVFAVLFLDLDRFKNINDSFGHKLGDKVLKHVTSLIVENCKEECLVSRFGGDEFVLICSEIENEKQATIIASELIKKIEQPFLIEDIMVYISASIGIAFYPEDGADMSALIRNADTAMYKTKKDVDTKILFYHTEYGDETTHFISTEHNIHVAIDNNEFIPYYQPKVDMRDGRIIGVEALARWMNPVQGMIMPGKFIDVAEETGQIVQLGLQVTEKIIDDMKRWRELGLNIPVAMNVSARQFSNSRYCEKLGSIVKAGGIDPENIEIEITEQVFLGDLTMAKTKLDKFRKSGFKIALDDFGTGYSSLSYLSELPIDILKIDKSFINNLADDKTSLAIMKAIASMCKDLDYFAIAEGVETEQQKNILLDLDCSIAQGFLFYKPMTAGKLVALTTKQ